MSSRAGMEALARGNGQRAPPAEVALLDRPAGEERAGDAEYAQDHLL